MRSFEKSASRRRRRTSVVIPMLTILLAGGVILSTVMLGESLGKVTPRQTNIIFLVPPSKSAPQTGETNTVYINPAPGSEEDPNAVLAEREVRVYENSTPAYEGGTKLKTQSEAMEEYYKSQSSGNGSSEGIFHGELDVTDSSGRWDSETRIDLFKSSYGGVESSRGDKVIAPGTSNYYDFTIENNGNIPLDYTISIGVEAFPYDSEPASKLPLEWRLVDKNGEDVSGWKTYTGTTGVLQVRTLDIYKKDDYTIEWRWQFERGDDEYDTYIGNLSAEIPVGVDATIYVTAEQNPYWHPQIPDPPDDPDEPVIPPDDVQAPDLVESNDNEVIPADKGSDGSVQDAWKSNLQSASRTADRSQTAHRALYTAILAVSLTGLVIIFIIVIVRKKHDEENADDKG